VVIRFECSCGRRLKAAEADAGQTVECPYCGLQRPVPLTEVGAPDDIPVAEVVAEPPVAEVAAPLPDNAGTQPGKLPGWVPPAAANPLDAMAQALRTSNGGGAEGTPTPMPRIVPAPSLAAPMGGKPRVADARPAPAKSPATAAQKAAALASLDALARVAGPPPTKPNGRSAATNGRTAANGRTAVAGKPASVAGRNPPAGGASLLQHRTLLIAIGASVLIAILFVVVALFVGGGGSDPKRESPPPPPPPPPQAPDKPERPKRSPGELFPNSPWQ
jgi:hypothetical protein